MIKIYRKTSTIKAEQFDPENSVIPEGVFDKEYEHTTSGMISAMVDELENGHQSHNWHIKTLEGDLKVNPGDWIATGLNGEHWPIADDIFKKTYAELPVIPNYVAEYIDYMKSTDCDIWDAIHYPFKSNKVDKYMEDDSETFALAWLDGYTVED
jgi:hypothetical protein|nr:MAG TPA: Protein of unknown function (DUF1642) [Caudoviricetes sp.]